MSWIDFEKSTQEDIARIRKKMDSLLLANLEGEKSKMDFKEQVIKMMDSLENLEADMSVADIMLLGTLIEFLEIVLEDQTKDSETED